MGGCRGVHDIGGGGGGRGVPQRDFDNQKYISRPSVYPFFSNTADRCLHPTKNRHTTEEKSQAHTMTREKLNCRSPREHRVTNQAASQATGPPPTAATHRRKLLASLPYLRGPQKSPPAYIIHTHIYIWHSSSKLPENNIRKSRRSR